MNNALQVSGITQPLEDIESVQLGLFARPGMKWINFDENLEPLSNPHKGWAIHYYDNSLVHYGSRLADDDLADFPGFNTVYLRLAWAYLEPEEGRFAWNIIDEPISRWVAGIDFVADHRIPPSHVSGNIG